MKSRLLGIAVVLVALALIINALALQSANVTSKFAIDVVGSASGLVAIKSAATGQDPDITITEPTGQAVISLPSGKGLQPGSVYVFDAAFAIKNNSGESLDIAIDPMPAVNGVSVSFEASTLGGVTSFTDLLSTNEVGVKMTVTVAEGATVGSLPPTTTLTIHATR